jgi:2-amino-4-hydroxy-6-hydroxymethyldihydropteridine diphosphokinase
MSHQVFLGLGTNLGQRQHNLEQAIAGLDEVVNVTAVSPIYETEPWGLVEQPAFLNACLSGKTEHSPQNLLSFIKNLETEMGREATQKWGPRLIDIDILLYENTVLQMNGLTIPHPHLHERAFVLAPLADIAPEVEHPVLGQTIGELRTAVNLSTVHRLPNPLFFSSKIEPLLNK